MVTEQNINELEELLEIFKRVVRRLNSLNPMSWKTQVKIPLTGETITYSIPDTKKQEIIQDAINKRNVLKAKIESINWTSLD